MEAWLGIPARLDNAIDHQIPSCLIGVPGWLAISNHRLIARVRRILPINYTGHPHHRRIELLLGYHTVMQPIGDMLA